MTSTELKHQANLQQWSQDIQDCRASGLPVKKWCVKQGTNVNTYYRRERMVLVEAQKQEAASGVSFAELPTPSLTQLRNVSQSVATVRYHDMSLDIYPGMDADTLRQILAAIRSC